MDITSLITGLLVGTLLGGLLAWLAARARVVGLGAERDGLRERMTDMEASLGADTETAAALAPMGEALRRVTRKVEQLERDRVDQFATVRDALGRVEQTTTRVGHEAASLASSLRVSSVRGAWGEVQLRRVLEVSGLMARCDFEEQAKGTTPSGLDVRPDVVVHLPGEKNLVVDAKAPMSQWLQAQAEDIDPDERSRLMEGHAAALRGHVATLASKAYWTAFDPSPEMVVCFVPSDATLAAALAQAPGLHEEAMASKVVLASPSTLLALLRTVAFTWQQDAVTRDARELLTVGRELYARLGILGEHATRMGRSLQRSVEDYNRLVGSLESRVLVSARRMGEIGVTTDEIDEVPAVTTTPRPLTAPELIDAVTAADARPDLDLEGVAHPDRHRKDGVTSRREESS
ncbi:DNA recombination protein RmuC [Janibacter cremeus]|uniref:DNA recombination protein RmuC n=1 Tax=Janibacter cremeus TaxID=1285192 RepID=A0A852VPD1_9MICO|nr:DNA recombination protein RmuC [Janibacter cremeus]NYF97568.1 DNA recombination protein RmuC [Janibacter cremeus]